jgi:hypothetical protein
MSIDDFSLFLTIFLLFFLIYFLSNLIDENFHLSELVLNLFFILVHRVRYTVHVFFTCEMEIAVKKIPDNKKWELGGFYVSQAIVVAEVVKK